MRVCHLYDGHERVRGRGSVPDVVWSLASRTAALDHDVVVIERQWRGTPPTEAVDGVQFQRVALRTGADEPWVDVPYEMIGSPLGAARLLLDRANFARATRPLLDRFDVVHCHLPFAAAVLATLQTDVAARLVYTAHLGETDRRVREPVISPDAWLARRAARTVALNPAMRDAFADRGVPTDRLRVVPNGVDDGRFDGVSAAERDRVRAAYDLGDQIVLFVGSVTPRKRVDDLVAAAGRVLPERDAHLVVVGPLDLAPDYVERVRAAVPGGLADRVTFTGFVSEADLQALYDLATVFALPSSEEGSSVAVTEALAAGLPVVATDIPGIAGQVQHGTHGLLAAPGDVDAMADHLARLLDDPAERESMAEAARDRARRRSWDEVVEAYLDLYREVAG